jgi:outer membrane lipoprotein-sorting protein
MGSDLSYEDTMDDPKPAKSYEANVVGSEASDGRQCWILQLIAKKEGIPYYSRKLWVDKERNIPLKEELYAKSGKLVKRLELKDVKNVQGRWYPTQMKFKDMLKTGDGTEFLVNSIRFDQEIPAYVFSKAALRK